MTISLCVKRNSRRARYLCYTFTESLFYVYAIDGRFSATSSSSSFSFCEHMCALSSYACAARVYLLTSFRILNENRINRIECIILPRAQTAAKTEKFFFLFVLKNGTQSKWRMGLFLFWNRCRAQGNEQIGSRGVFFHHILHLACGSWFAVLQIIRSTLSHSIRVWNGLIWNDPMNHTVSIRFDLLTNVRAVYELAPL